MVPRPPLNSPPNPLQVLVAQASRLCLNLQKAGRIRVAVTSLPGPGESV